MHLPGPRILQNRPCPAGIEDDQRYMDVVMHSIGNAHGNGSNAIDRSSLAAWAVSYCRDLSDNAPGSSKKPPLEPFTFASFARPSRVDVPELLRLHGQ